MRLFARYVVAFALGMAAGSLALNVWHSHGSVPSERPPRRWEATLYLPLVDNRDQRIEEATWRAAVTPLVRAFDGVTLGAAQEGCWRDRAGTVRCEPVRPVIVSFAAPRLEEFRRIVRELGQQLGQEAIYVRFEEPHVEVLAIPAELPENLREPAAAP